MTKRQTKALLSLLLLALAPTTWAAPKTEGWTFSELQWENDDIFPQPDREPGDRYYTNGIRLSWVNVDEDQPGWVEETRSFLCAKTANACEARGRFTLGQNFFTPEDIDDPEPQLDDRPWAGWLYASLGVAAGEVSYQHDLELQVGLTGYASLGPFIQTQWHRAINTHTPKGWSNTYESEVGANAFYQYQRILFRGARLGPLEWDVVPRVGAALGTIQTYATAGATLRLGKNISGFPAKLIQPTIYSPAIFRSRQSGAPASDRGRQRWEFYAFIGADGRAKLHDYFLEGSLFRNDPGVEPEDFVTDFQYGLAGEYRGWRVAYTINYRSAEFKDVPGSGIGSHTFGSVSVSRPLGQ